MLLYKLKTALRRNLVGIKMTNAEVENLLFYSFRYALGRRTYAVSDVSTALITYKHALSSNTKAIICMEIGRAVIAGDIGAYCDECCWLRVCKELEDE